MPGSSRARPPRRWQSTATEKGDTMDLWFIIINAIVLACIYGTLAIGVSITWSSLGLVNLSYGFIFAFAGYGAWLFAQHVSTFGVLVLAAGILAGALGGVIVC